MAKRKFIIGRTIILSASLSLLPSVSASPHVVAPRAAALLSRTTMGEAAAPSSITCFQLAWQNRFTLYMHGYHDVLTPEAVLKTLQEHPALCGWLIVATR